MSQLELIFPRIRISRQHSECKIICGPHEFDVHKIVLISQSDYFEVILREGTFEEGETGVIRLKALPADTGDQSEADPTLDDPEIIKLMVSFFYHFEYFITKSVDATHTSTDNDALAPRPSSKAVMHAKVFAAAIKYQVDGLRDLAAENFTTALKGSLRLHWGGYGDYAEHLAARQVDVTAFAEVLTVVFESTPDEVTQLRDAVLEVLLDNFASFKSNHDVEEAMSNIPSLGYELLRRSSLRPPPQATRSSFVFTCMACRQVKCEHLLPKSEICDRCTSAEKQLPVR